jgi:hypothetical protein
MPGTGEGPVSRPLQASRDYKLVRAFCSKEGQWTDGSAGLLCHDRSNSGHGGTCRLLPDYFRLRYTSARFDLESYELERPGPIHLSRLASRVLVVRHFGRSRHTHQSSWERDKI